MIIKFTNYENGIHEVSLIKRADKLQMSEQFFGNIEVDCRMDKSSHQIVLDCTVQANAHLVCDRCNTDYAELLENDFQLIYAYDKEVEGDEEDDNYRVLTPDQDKIDLTDDAVQFAELALPMKSLCKEECKGLCHKCGADLNSEQCTCSEETYNPQWEALQKLKGKLGD